MPATSIRPESELLLDPSPPRAPMNSFGLSLSQAARALGVSIGTLRRWSDLGQLESSRTPTGQCRFSETQIRACVDSLEGRREFDLSRDPLERRP